MEYFRCRWLHSSPDFPVLLYTELDEQRWETRKVEVFSDGRHGYADATRSQHGSLLGLETVPSIETIAANPEFEPELISAEEFEEIWRQATSDKGN